MKHPILIMLGLVLLSCCEQAKTEDHLGLQSKLSGKWKAAAFDGELHETWTLNDKGWMQQEGFYIEKSDTSYAAQTQVQSVGDDVILFSVIRNSNPKIFKQVHSEENKMVFENDDYKNPFQVTYEFLSDSSYRRTIRGYEEDSIVVFQFNFKKCTDCFADPKK